jgi:ribosomal protein S27AE
MWESFLVKKDDCKNLTMWILLAHHVQRHTCVCKACENCQKSGFISKHKESLDNLLLTFETYTGEDVHCAFQDL